VPFVSARTEIEVITIPRRHDEAVSVLRDLPRFRSLWLSKAISSAGTGGGRIALVLFAAPSGPGAVSLVLIGTALPLLAGPLAGAVADRMDQRRLLAGCEAGQGVIYATLAVTRPPLPALLPLVILASLLAAFGSPAGKSAVRRLVPAGHRGQANALLTLAMDLQIVAGPAIGGVLAGFGGVPVAFGVNAASFALSALLLAGLGPLPPLDRPGQEAAPSLLADTMAGLRYASSNRAVRSLVLGTFTFVVFAAVDNVALVFLVRRALHGSPAEYGLISAVFGAGMVAASLALTVKASRMKPAFWLAGGVIAGAAGTALTGIAPSAALVSAGQALAGAGNTADLVGTDTLIQEQVPAHLQGRAFGTVYGGIQLASALSYLIAGPLVALTGPRATFVIAGVGALASATALVPALRSQPAPTGDGQSGLTA
jgi:MFS family permease